MSTMIQHKPMFVPFQERPANDFASSRQKRVMRSFKASMIAFLIAVVVVSFATNRHEAQLRAAKSVQTCSR